MSVIFCPHLPGRFEHSFPLLSTPEANSSQMKPFLGLALGWREPATLLKVTLSSQGQPLLGDCLMQGIKAWPPCSNLGPHWRVILGLEMTSGSDEPWLWLHYHSSPPIAQFCFFYSAPLPLPQRLNLRTLYFLISFLWTNQSLTLVPWELDLQQLVLRVINHKPKGTRESQRAFIQRDSSAAEGQKSWETGQLWR